MSLGTWANYKELNDYAWEQSETSRECTKINEGNVSPLGNTITFIGNLLITVGMFKGDPELVVVCLHDRLWGHLKQCTGSTEV